MTWTDDEIDVALTDTAQRFAASDYNFEDRRRLTPAERRFSPRTWSAMAEMGWLGVGTSEDRGGLGLRISSIAVLAGVGGAMFLNEPLVDTAFVGAALIEEVEPDGPGSELATRICDGAVRLGVALNAADRLPADASAPRVGADGRLNGYVPFIPGADIADTILVRAADPDGATALFLIDPAAAGVVVDRYPLIDGRGAGALRLEQTDAIRLGGPGRATDAAIDRAALIGALATAADTLGVVRVAFDQTVDYLKTRVQFGRPIGTNQALQHRAVDMHIQLAEATAALDFAIRTPIERQVDFAQRAHAAKAIMDRVARPIVHESIQLHGGIGMADEHVVGQCLRRVIVNEQLYGQRTDHLAAFAAGLTDDLSCR